MPILDQGVLLNNLKPEGDEATQSPNNRIFNPEQEDKKPGWLFDDNWNIDPENSTLASALRIVSPIGSNLNILKNNPSDYWLYKPFKELNPDFDPSIYAKDFMDNPDAIIYATSKEEIDQIKAMRDRERADLKRISDAGTAGAITAFAAGIIDPMTLAPGVAIAKGVTSTGNLLKTVAYSSALSAGATSASELALSATQYDKDFGESGSIIAMSAVIGGALGAGAYGAQAIRQSVADSAKTATRVASFESEASDIINNETINVAKQTANKADSIEAGIEGAQNAAESTQGPPPGSFAAAKTLEEFQTIKSEETIARLNQTVARTLAGTPVFEGTLVKGLTDRSGVVRRMTNEIFEHNLQLNKNTAGKATQTSIESLVNLEYVKGQQTVKDVLDLYKTYIGAKTDLGAALKSVWTTKNRMNMDQFMDQVGIAIEKGDDGFAPEVIQAKRILTNHFNKRREELKSIGKAVLSDEDIAYLTHVYNQPKIAADRNILEDRIVNHWKTEAANGNLDFVGKSEKDLRQLAENKIDGILGIDDQRVSLSDLGAMMSARGTPRSSKERTISLPDEIFDGYRETNALKIFENYESQMVPYIQYNKRLQELGFESVNDVRQLIKNEYQALRKAGHISSAEEKVQLNRSLDLFNKSTDIILNRAGRNGIRDRILGLIRQYNFMTMLGGVVISSLTDTVIPVVVHGPIKWFTEGIYPILRSLKAAKLSSDEVQTIIGGLENEMNSVVRQIGGVDKYFRSSIDDYTRSGQWLARLESAADKGTTTMSHLSGMIYWNNTMHRFAGRMAANTILNRVFKETITQDEITDLARLGLNKSDLSIIKSYGKKYINKDRGSWTTNFDAWPNKDVAKRFAAAVMKETNTMFIKPSKGDTPTWASTSGIGKSIYQFHTFTSAFANKILLRGAQRRDLTTAFGIVALVGMGAMIDTLHRLLGNRELEDNPLVALKNGVLRSAVAGPLGDYLAGIFNANTRYQDSAGKLINIAGPTVSQAKTVLDIGTNILEGDEWTKGEIKGAARLIPFQNLFYLRPIMNELSTELGETKENIPHQNGDPGQALYQLNQSLIMRPKQ